MYDSNITAWVVSTLAAVISVGMIAPLLSIYTYGPHNSGRIKRICIYVVSIAIIGGTGVYGYHSTPTTSKSHWATMVTLLALYPSTAQADGHTPLILNV